MYPGWSFQRITLLAKFRQSSAEHNVPGEATAACYPARAGAAAGRQGRRTVPPYPGDPPVVEAWLDGRADDRSGRDDPRAPPRRRESQRACRHAKATWTPRRTGPSVPITPDHPFRGDARVVRRTARCGNVVTCRRCRPAAGMSVPCERGEETVMSGPLVDLACCHLDRDRVLARPCRRLAGPQLHRVLHLQPVLLPGRDHRLPGPGPHPKSLAGKGPLPANAQVAGDLRATCCAEIFLIRNEGGRL
jgi:hypothetical protein